MGCVVVHHSQGDIMMLFDSVSTACLLKLTAEPQQCIHRSNTPLHDMAMSRTLHACTCILSLGKAPHRQSHLSLMCLTPARVGKNGCCFKHI